MPLAVEVSTSVNAAQLVAIVRTMVVRLIWMIWVVGMIGMIGIVGMIGPVTAFRRLGGMITIGSGHRMIGIVGVVIMVPRIVPRVTAIVHVPVILIKNNNTDAKGCP